MPAFRSVYIHVPFCRHRCGYCDFTLVAGRDDLIDRYIAALDQEMASQPAEGPLDTLFLGGGTPTHPPREQFCRLLETIRSRFSLAPDAEFCLEANPLDLCPERVALLKEFGVTRVSLGGQTFQPRHLKTLERDHTAEQIADVIERLAAVIPNISLDLIFGVPGQTLAEWEEDLDRAISLPIQHLATYGLTFEEGTAFMNRLRKGELHSLDEELERSMYAAAMDRLPAAGVRQYELSNFARPGFECRHNRVYWTGRPFAAFGPGAAAYLGGRRTTNVRSVLGYLDRSERGLPLTAEDESLEPEHRAREYLFIGLRKIEGIGHEEFLEATGYDLLSFAGVSIAAQAEAGLLVSDENGIRLTHEGRFVANRVMEAFL